MLLLKLLVNGLAVFIAAYLLKGVYVKNFLHALWAAALLALINAVIRPILIFLTIPITVLTLGFFILVIDALLLMLVDKILPGLKIKNFGWALLFAIVLAIVNLILSWIFF